MVNPSSNISSSHSSTSIHDSFGEGSRHSHLHDFGYDEELVVSKASATRAADRPQVFQK